MYTSVCCAMYLVQNLYCLSRIMQFPFAVELPSFIVRLRISFVTHIRYAISNWRFLHLGTLLILYFRLLLLWFRCHHKLYLIYIYKLTWKDCHDSFLASFSLENSDSNVVFKLQAAHCVIVSILRLPTKNERKKKQPRAR